MWIMKQGKNELINTDILINIYIEQIGHEYYVKASVPTNDAAVGLGVYQTRADAGLILKRIFKAISAGDLTFEMPLGTEV